MSGENSSGSATPSDAGDDLLSIEAKELKALEGYVKSLPYGCETTDEMQEKLRVIVEKIYVCVQTNSWAPSVGWDHMLQYWLIMRYPLPRTTRATLVKLYYELIISPGSESRLLGGWADMLARLIPHKTGSRPKLFPEDLQLDWKPLWLVLKKQIFASASDADDALRSDAATYLTVAGLIAPYIPATEIPAILDELLPYYTYRTATTIFTLLTSFLPPYDSHLYLPIMFKLWEAINSSNIDERMLEACAALTRENMSRHGPFATPNVEPWKDVGILDEFQWARICRACLVAMNVPVGPRTTSSVSSTGTTADAYQTNKLTRKGPSALTTLPMIFVWSIALDGPIASKTESSDGSSYVAGSKALTSLRTLITSVETYFHPSNYGSWSVNLTSLINRLAAEFCARWYEEQAKDCAIPVARRLSKDMRREFVETLKTPALLAMFSKDPISTSYAHSTLRYLATIEPSVIMPAILERSYSGLESVNETHRVLAVMSALACVSGTLTSETKWLGGQKHIVPLLELAIPGIDINDPTKTIVALAFIASVVSEIKIGDLTQAPALSLGDDAPGESMDTEQGDDYRMPDGTEDMTVPLDRDEERTLARDSSTSFPDLIVTFFRRVLAIFEALPEEGGKSNKTGGKLEEALLKTVRSTTDTVAMQLSDELFDLVLGIIYEYATTNTRANAVKAFGNLVGSFAKANSKKVLAKFLPYSVEQIKTELEHGASSVRTTAVGLAIPSDTALHWHMAIIRGAISGDGSDLVAHKDLVLKLIKLLVDGAKNERGFSGTGRLVNRILTALTSVYPKDSRFLNPSEWSDPRARGSHNQLWGKMYKVEEVEIAWHVPSDVEVALAIQILDQVIAPVINVLDKSLATPPNNRDSIWRNDFCRLIHIARSAWSGLSTIIELPFQEYPDRYIDAKTEIPQMSASSVRMKAGFCVTSPSDPRYAHIMKHREFFGKFLNKAAAALNVDGPDGGDEHVDAILSVIRSIDCYLLEYAASRNTYASSKKAYDMTRDLVVTSSKQKSFPRSIWVKRAQVYHVSRVHTHSLYRRRTALDEKLIVNLLEFSISSYTRARKNAQSALSEAISYYVRSARLVLDGVLRALDAQGKLGKNADPDKQKGALHLLWNRSLSLYALITPQFILPYYEALFALRSQEKPSIQKLVASAMDGSIGHITSEAMATTKASFMPEASTKQALEELSRVAGPFDPKLLKAQQQLVAPRDELKKKGYDSLRAFALRTAQDSTLHWKYQHWGLVLLVQLTRRDAPASPEMGKIFVQEVVSDHPTMRHAAQRGLVKILRGVKARTLSPDARSLWLNERKHPLRAVGKFSSLDDMISKSQSPIGSDRGLLLIDSSPNHPLVWKAEVRGYTPPPPNASAFSWEPASQSTLDAIGGYVDSEWFAKLITLWSQEEDRSKSSTDIRLDNLYVIKQLVKIFEGRHLSHILASVEGAMYDSDKFKQRAAAEILTGLIRGLKHVPLSTAQPVWDWLTPRLPEIYSKLTLDTLSIWQSFLSNSSADRDPRRIQPIIDFIKSIKIDFNSSSVFSLSKAMDWTLTLTETLGARFISLNPNTLDIYIQNLGTSYAEIRTSIINMILAVMSEEWRPEFKDSAALLAKCSSSTDPLLVRDTRHQAQIMAVVEQLPKLRAERLPGANVSQSLYDKIGLTLLTWIWTVAYSPRAPSIFVYTKPFLPEVLRMSELQDSSEVQQYSSGVLYILASINPPPELIGPFTESFIGSVRTSSSWRIRQKAIPVLSVWYFRNIPSIPISTVRQILDALVECLSDENVEVREQAATTLSGVLRSRTEKETVITLKDRFSRIAQRVKLPKRDDPKYADVLRKLHAAVLGMIATLQAYPYVIEPWIPALIERLARHASDPQPVSSAIRKFAADFKKTHQDTWHVDKELFNEDQSQALQTIVAGTSYYA